MNHKLLTAYSLALVTLAGARSYAAGRPTPPTRDPHTSGYAEAKELPDSQIPPVDAEGNFIVGPTHDRPAESTAHEDVPQGTIFNLKMESADSKIYPGIAREQGHFRHARSERSVEARRHDKPFRSVHEKGHRLCPQAVRSGYSGAVHRGCRRTGPAVVYGIR